MRTSKAAIVNTKEEVVEDQKLIAITQPTSGGELTFKFFGDWKAIEILRIGSRIKKAYGVFKREQRRALEKAKTENQGG